MDRALHPGMRHSLRHLIHPKHVRKRRCPLPAACFLRPAACHSAFAPPPVATYSYARRGGCRPSVLASPRIIATIEIVSEPAARRPELARNAALGYAPGSWRIRRGVVL